MKKTRLLFMIALLSFMPSACLSLHHSARKDLSAVIVDDSGAPIAGAVFYAEAFVPNEGAFDFVFAVSDTNGGIPAEGSEPLNIAWQRGARLALAVLAADYQPFAIYAYEDLVQANGIQIMMQAQTDSPLAWEPRLGHFSFPFEQNAELAKRLRQAEYKKLRRAFLQAYQPLIAGKVSAMPREVDKIKFLQYLEPVME